MEHTFVADLGLALAVASITGVIARRLRQPAIVGYLAAGLVIGPYVPIPLAADPERIHALAEFGVVLVMFVVGLEFRVSRLLSLLPRAGLTATLQIGSMCVLGSMLAAAVGFSALEQVFLGAALAISSTMVVSNVFASRPVDRATQELVLGVLVVQDIVAIVLLAVLSGVAEGASLAPAATLWTLVQLATVMVTLAGAGMLVVPRVVRSTLAFESPEATAVVAAAVGFAFAGASMMLGYSPALGAFLGGVLVAEVGAAHHLEHTIRPLRDVFAAVFFVSIGMEVDPRVVAQDLPTVLAATAVVIAGQLASVTVGGVLSGNGLRTSIGAGLALGQVGEFGFLLASVAGRAGGSRVSGVVVGVALLTVLTTSWAVGRSDQVADAVERRLPPRVRTGLDLYRTWFVALREGPARSPLLRALAVWTVDAGGLMTVLVAFRLWNVPLTARLLALGLTPGTARAAAVGVAVFAAAPFVLGGVRTGWSLAARVASRVGEADDPRTRLVRLVVQLLAVLGVGFPTVALTRPLIGDGPTLALVVVTAAMGLGLWRRLGQVEEAALESGAAGLVRWLQRDAGADSAPSFPRDDRYGPLEGAVQVEIAAGSAAVGQTLRELDLRARTGASVVAILRNDHSSLPEPDQTLQPMDRLLMLGDATSLERARAVFVEGGAVTPS
ncbi:MAG: cation:proton antiporter [Myxococcales bacterium]|nr:cation:proton antiporter [Myxococcales bacterium]